MIHFVGVIHLVGLLVIGLLTTDATAQETSGTEETGAEASLEQMRELIDAIQARVDAMSAVAEDRDAALDVLGQQVRQASRSLSSGHDENSSLKQENADLAARLEILAADREKLSRALDGRGGETERLITENSNLERELAAVSSALRDAEEKKRKQDQQIRELIRRLSSGQSASGLTAARKVFIDQLALRLADSGNVRRHDGRLVLQSDILFAPGSATLDAAGKDQLRLLSSETIDAIQGISGDIRWMIRIEGHTDSGSVQSAEFPTDWHLSIARAMAVVEFLVENGVPSERLEAAGFGALRPIDDTDDEIAARRNRRIAFYLTQG